MKKLDPEKLVLIANRLRERLGNLRGKPLTNEDLIGIGLGAMGFGSKEWTPWDTASAAGYLGGVLGLGGPATLALAGSLAGFQAAALEANEYLEEHDRLDKQPVPTGIENIKKLEQEAKRLKRFIDHFENNSNFMKRSAFSKVNGVDHGQATNRKFGELRSKYFRVQEELGTAKALRDFPESSQVFGSKINKDPARWNGQKKSLFRLSEHHDESGVSTPYRDQGVVVAPQQATESGGKPTDQTTPASTGTALDFHDLLGNGSDTYAPAMYPVYEPAQDPYPETELERHARMLYGANDKPLGGDKSDLNTRQGPNYPETQMERWAGMLYPEEIQP